MKKVKSSSNTKAKAKADGQDAKASQKPSAAFLAALKAVAAMGKIKA